MARYTVEIQKEGYFNNDMLMQQVENALNIFEAKYPYARARLFNALSHKKLAENQLNVECTSWRQATIHERHNMEWQSAKMGVRRWKAKGYEDCS